MRGRTNISDPIVVFTGRVRGRVQRMLLEDSCQCAKV